MRAAGMDKDGSEYICPQTANTRTSGTASCYASSIRRIISSRFLVLPVMASLAPGQNRTPGSSGAEPVSQLT